MPALQNYSVNFCNLFSVNLETVLLKNNLKYFIFSLVLLGSVSLGMLKIFLREYLLTDFSNNLVGICFSVKYPRSKWKPLHTCN